MVRSIAISVVGVAISTLAAIASSSSCGSRSSAGARNESPGHEQHDELRRRLERPPVLLRGQPLHVLAQVARVGVHPGLDQVGVAGLGGVEVGGERDLRVDDHLLAAGEPHDEVGPQGPVVAGHRRLLGEVAVLDHAGQLDDPPELHLAPPAAGLRRPQRVHQRGRLVAQLLAGGAHEPDLLGQRGVRRHPGVLELAQVRLDLAERLAQRGHRHGDVLAAVGGRVGDGQPLAQQPHLGLGGRAA